MPPRVRGDTHAPEHAASAMPVSIPGPDKPSFLSREWPEAVATGIGALPVAAIAAWKTRHDGLAEWVFWTFVVIAGWSALTTGLKVARAIYKDRKAEDEESPMELVGCLQVLYEIVGRRKGLGDSAADRARFRVTLHRVDEKGDRLQQCVPYLGGDGSKMRKAGRWFPRRCGVIGRTARTGDPQVVIRTTRDHALYLKELVADWGYSPEEAEALSRDRFSAMAVPVYDKPGRPPIGVVFADSDDPDFFDADIQELVISASVGLAAFVQDRYS
jgi:hypothetical protein